MTEMPGWTMKDMKDFIRCIQIVLSIDKIIKRVVEENQSVTENLKENFSV